MTYKVFFVLGLLVVIAMVVATICIATTVVSTVTGYAAAIAALYTIFVLRPRR
jgi:hypothetical protein